MQRPHPKQRHGMIVHCFDITVPSSAPMRSVCCAQMDTSLVCGSRFVRYPKSSFCFFACLHEMSSCILVRREGRNASVSGEVK